jgi:hypothetical protein
MRSAAELFLELSSASDVPGSGGGRTGIEPDLIGLCDRIRDAYLAQQDIPDLDIDYGPRLFALVGAAMVAENPAAAAPEPRAWEKAAEPDVWPSPPAMTLAVVLAATLIGSIAIGSATLSIVLTAALGLAAYIAAGGKVLGVSIRSWPFRAGGRAGTAASAITDETPKAARRPELEQLESACRQIDLLLAMLRDARRPDETTTSVAPLDDSHLRFLQDLAEAGSAGDGDHMVNLAQRRLPSILRRLGLRLGTFAEDGEPCFVTDTIPDEQRRGTAATVRPAIMQGDHCLLRGYAQRYV